VKDVQIFGRRIALAVRLETMEGGEGWTEILVVELPAKTVIELQIFLVVCRYSFVSITKRIAHPDCPAVQ